MNRQSFLATLAAVFLAKPASAQPKYKDGYCPTCNTKASAWEMDKPCKREEAVFYEGGRIIHSNGSGYSNGIGGLWPTTKTVNPDAPPCKSVNSITSSRDWKSHVCQTCKTIFAIPA